MESGGKTMHSYGCITAGRRQLFQERCVLHSTERCWVVEHERLWIWFSKMAVLGPLSKSIFATSCILFQLGPSPKPKSKINLSKKQKPTSFLLLGNLQHSYSKMSYSPSCKISSESLSSSSLSYSLIWQPPSSSSSEEDSTQWESCLSFFIIVTSRQS